MSRRRLPAEVHQAKGDPSKKGEVVERAVQSALQLGDARSVGKLADLTDREKILDWLVQFAKRLAFIRETDSVLVWQLSEAIWEHNQATSEIRDQNSGQLTYEAESYVNARGEEDNKPVSKLIRVHPGVMIRRRARQDITRLCDQLGFSPLSRFRLFELAVDARDPSAGKVRQPPLGEGDQSQDTPAAFH